MNENETAKHQLIEFVNPDFVLENEKGLLVQLVHDGMKQVNVIYSKGNSVRGGHYHKFNTEAFYIIAGTFRLILHKDGQKEEHWIKAGDMFIIKENVFHTFDYTEDTWLVSMYSNGVEMDFGKDIWTI